jgi:glyoxylase-like metal-dependent hydrolase (beta-lactamase superfamily II)
LEIIPGVFAINTHRMGRAYLYQEADKLTLIDCGFPGRTNDIIGAIEGLGRRVGDVRQIILTHWHIDHAGCLADLVSQTDAEVVAHRIDAPIVRGEREGPPPKNVMAKLIDRVGPKLTPARVDRDVEDGDQIDLGGGATVVHAPGHTAGSIAIHLPGRKLLFTGDALANALGVRGSVGFFTEDGEQAKQSARKLATLDFDVACFGHGPPLDKEASLAVRRYADKLS